MKKMLIIIALAAGVVSCKTKTGESLDTQKEMVVTYPAYNNSILTDHGNMGKATAISNNMPRSYSNTPSNTRTNNNNVSSGNANTTTASTNTTTRKKGWSNRAKGTVIGAGSGALIGAIVSKKKGKGAIIGGLLGAGAGYVIGNEKDKKKNK